MSAARTLLALCMVGCAAPGGDSRGSSAPPPRYEIGRPAVDSEIATWNTDVGPDGVGLPAGQGSAAQGAPIYAAKCAACHGANGTEGPNDVLVETTLADSFPFSHDSTLRAKQAVGNFWPYATTLYDYIARAMPFDKPGSLEPNEVYALVAFLLNRNALIADTVVIDAKTLPAVRMPAHDRFVVDDRRGGAEVK